MSRGRRHRRVLRLLLVFSHADFLTHAGGSLASLDFQIVASATAQAAAAAAETRQWGEVVGCSHRVLYSDPERVQMRAAVHSDNMLGFAGYRIATQRVDYGDGRREYSLKDYSWDG